jgi:hypothetical protein
MSKNTSNDIQFPRQKQPIPASENFVPRRKIDHAEYEPNGKQFIPVEQLMLKKQSIPKNDNFVPTRKKNPRLSHVEKWEAAGIVVHTKFGMGRVIDHQEWNGRRYVVVKFITPGIGIKILASDDAKLERIIR